MHVTKDTVGAWNVLLALDGELVGPVDEAYVADACDGGYVTRVVADEPVRLSGRVDVVGRCDDPPKMIRDRLASIRAHVGNPALQDLVQR